MADKKAPAKKADTKKPVYESQESLYAKAVIKMNEDAVIVQHAYKAETYRRAAEMFELVGDYEDAPELAEQCRQMADDTEEEARRLTFAKAKEKEEKADAADSKTASYEYGKALELYQGLGDYEESAQRAEYCEKKLAALSRKQKRHTTAVLLVIAAVIAMIVYYFTSSMFPYSFGRIYEKAGWEDNAVSSYKSAGGFYDSEVRIEGINDRKAARADHNNFLNLTEGEPGKECFFGRYKWLVLDRQGDYALMLLTNFVIAEHPDLWQIPYNEEQTEVSWLDCSLRKHLNTVVLEEDFSDEERERLMPISLEEDHPELPAEGGETDRVSILTVWEAMKYKKLLDKLGGVDYWLRSEGEAPGTAVVFSAMDRILYSGIPVSSTDLAVRPIILVNTAGMKEETE